jgi:hypothetical protein
LEQSSAQADLFSEKSIKRAAAPDPAGSGRSAMVVRMRRALWDTTITEILAGIYEPDTGGKRRRSRCTAA